MDTTTVETEDRDGAEAEAHLREAEAARDADYRRAGDRGELGGAQGTWKRLPLDEATASSLRSDADWRVKQARWALAKAKRPKLPVGEARAALARAEAHLGAARARLAQIVTDKTSDDRVTARQAARSEKDAVDAVLDGEVVLEIAAATVRDAEQAEVARRTPLHLLRAVGLARRLDQKLADSELVAIVDEMIELAEQSHAAGGRVDCIFPGLLPERVDFWRSQQKALGRL